MEKNKYHKVAIYFHDNCGDILTGLICRRGLINYALKEEKLSWITETYFDNNDDNLNPERPVLKRMVKDAKSGKIDILFIEERRKFRKKDAIYKVAKKLVDDKLVKMVVWNT